MAEKPILPSDSKLSPYLQGNLDSLCSVYAVINALRWTLADHPLSAKGEHWRILFAELNDYAVKELGLLSLSSQGMGLNGMIWLLRTAQQHMAEAHAITFKTYRPFALRRPESSTCVIGEIKEHLHSPGTAVITAVYGKLNHWCVIKGINEKHAILFDSDRLYQTPLTIFQLTAHSNSASHSSRAQTGSILLLSMDKTTACKNIMQHS
ncbi:hypothetical protein [Pseudochrobactrum asaccharolyticum]|uniref:Papain like cysteine protease AvrRpt2 n=1 Tax=Pseudochrobactrum asaccharolyticum TaxID=354351 RepID=A0A366E6W9_9HYPH|nr:hypothetical protein [Pseudochrobactrum asaccharolyticum]MBX8802010.1 hypothetical protein [Ochrobactrum sp. MR28]MBX8817706.1 hypothetical protein [Ochrobactrum sp. MR31]RBO97234.1 hypothetical protein DFR47_10215 [Pseudochrobactrum asaccharolyticum]